MWQNLRVAVRLLLRSPIFSLIAVVAIALGVGASTTTFSAVNALLLRPWPHMQKMDRLLFLSEYFPRTGSKDNGLAFPDYLDFKAGAKRTLEGVGLLTTATMVIADGDRADRYLGAQVSANLPRLVGAEPVLGRNFREEEDRPEAAPVVLLGFSVWEDRFGSDPGVIGRVLTINGKPVTVVGVMPKGWRFPEHADLWMPLVTNAQENPRGNFNFDGLARMKPGVTIAESRAELEAVASRLAVDHPQSNSGVSAYVRSFREQVVRNSKSLTILLMGAVFFVHLIACANVANLLLARGVSRRREIAIRLALGAGRRAIVRQFLIESLLLGVVGSALGLLLSLWGVDLMVRAIPVEFPYWLRFNLDWRVFGFALLLGPGSAVFFGLFPALQASKPELIETIKEGGRGDLGGAHGARVRNGLVVAEVALALVLLVSASLMLRSFLKLQAMNVGVDPSNTLTFRLGLPDKQYTPDQAAQFFQALLPQLAALPGVEAANITSALPASGVGRSAVLLEGETAPVRVADSRQAHPLTVSPGFAAASRIPLLRGREFTIADQKNTPLVAMIDETAAAKWFPGVDPVGHRLGLVQNLGAPPTWATIVGVLGNVVYDRLVARQTEPCYYLSEFQSPESFMSVLLRTRVDPERVTKAAREAVAAVSKDIPIYRIKTFDQVIAESFWERKFFGSLFAVFAGLALFLAAIGLYGVMAYAVRQRTQEIGVRMALGAQARDVLKLITVHGMRLVGIGLGLGLLVAFFLMRLLQGSLEGISAHDPVSFALVSVVLALTGLLACFLPARRAALLNPVDALRHE